MSFQEDKHRHVSVHVPAVQPFVTWRRASSCEGPTTEKKYILTTYTVPSIITERMRQGWLTHVPWYSLYDVDGCNVLECAPKNKKMVLWRS
jgi:hypothetical protein